MSLPQKLETLRLAAAAEGIPLDCVGKLALKLSRVARLLDVSIETLERELLDGNLATTWIRSARRISVVDLVEYMHAHRTVGRLPKPGADAQLVESFRDG